MTTTYPRSTKGRLPGSEPEERGPAQVLLGFAALLGTIAIVAGVPIALISIFGTPWPSKTPTMAWLTSPTTTETVMAILAAVVWLAWLHFVICLAVEAVAAIRNRGIAPSIPGGGLGTQALARNLVITIMLLLGVTAASVAPAGADSTGTGAGTATVASQIEPAAQSGGTADARGDASSGRDATPDRGDRAGGLPAPGQLDSATKVDQQSGVKTYYEVKPPRERHYDTLWDIAERYLGDGLRYKELVELNRGVKQSDGTELTNPDLIYPGWILEMPADAKGPGLRVVEHAESGAPISPGLGHADGSSLDGKGAATAESDGASATEGGGIGNLMQSEWSPLFGVAGGLALGGAFLALRRRRATMPIAQLWATAGATPPEGPDGPGGPGGGPGSRLRDEANPAMATWMDRTLRGAGIGRNFPAPAQVSIGASGMAMSFTETPASNPPAGWVGVSERVWAVPAGVQAEATGPAPTPGLVTVGRREDDSLLLIDPEAVAGVIALEGPDDLARGLAMSMVVDTATHPWADQRHVTLVGFADDLTGIGNGTIHRSDDLARVLENLENLARYHRSACRQVGAASAREARVMAPGAADWSYQLVVCSGLPSLTELSRLHALAADPMVALGVVVIGALPSAEMRLAAHPDGRLTAPLQGIDVQIQTLDVPAIRALSTLYATPPARGVTFEEWAAKVSADAPIQTATEAGVRIGILGPVVIDAPGEVEPERSGFLTELASYLALQADGAHVNRIAAALWPRGVPDEIRDGALAQLADWFGEVEGQPVLREEAGVWSFLPGAVRLDWDEFRSDLNASAAPGANREELLRRALSQVRDLPFADVPDGRYAWLESTTIEADVRLAIALTSLAAAEAAADRDDPTTARVTLARGLQLLPANEDLWKARLRLEARFGERQDVGVIAESMYEALGEHGYGASGEMDALVGELLPGFRHRVA